MWGVTARAGLPSPGRLAARCGCDVAGLSGEGVCPPDLLLGAGVLEGLQTLRSPGPSLPVHFVTLALMFWGYFFKDFIYLFFGGKGGRKRGRETAINCLLYAPQPGTEPTTQACAPTGNRTRDLSLCGTTPTPRSHTGQGLGSVFLPGYGSHSQDGGSTAGGQGKSSE